MWDQPGGGASSKLLRVVRGEECRDVIVIARLKLKGKLNMTNVMIVMEL